MKKFDMIKNHLALVQLCRELEHQFYRIDKVVRPYGEDTEYKRAYSIIHSAIYKKELDAWRTLGMMALAGTPEQQKEVRALAYKRFFEEGKAVMYLTDDLSNQPSSWLSSDENEVRQWLKDNFEGCGNE